MKEQNKRQIAQHILDASFGLTPAEARVALGIARGETLASVAEAHGIAVTTAKTHLQSIFIKTGTHRQAELVALLARTNKAFC
jgi:DNA-binding CsgD family transcriptional regulator